ncbi:MAG TPA: acyl-CoA dehydrogenase family protein [Methylomirabilota bacterium]|jgi:alkylation response protein AidB-like acyl-CoA dehydrogenase|nr:acyl-CoA dehydrogenase family protein [Methylomirabilota bacterium]
MNFDFSADQKSLREQARKFLGEHASSTRVRRILEGAAPYDRALWKGMGEMGWMGTAIPETHGGAGFGYLELCVIAEELGRSLAPTPFASTIYLAAEALLLAGSDAQKKRWLPPITQGAAIGCLALAEGPRVTTPGNLATRAEGGRLTGTKLPVMDGDVADFAVVLAAQGQGRAGLYLVELTGPGVTRTTLATVDPTRSHARIVLDGAPAEPLGAAGQGWPLAERLLDRAAVLVAFEQIGGAQTALDMAREYAMGRFAFGRQIASFQAIKHKLADMYVGIELARSNAYYGAWALSKDAPELGVAAAAARVAASEAYYHAAKENIQVHGGMGFTWEFDCHLHYRRAKLTGLMLGSARRWKELLVSRLEAGAA